MERAVTVWCLWCSDELISLHSTYESAAKALQLAYAELRERYNTEKVKTGRYDHCIF